MELYNFMRSALAWTATIACLWPINIPLLFAAYRIREGRVPEGDDTRVDNEDLWPRCALNALLVALLAAAWIFVDLVAADWLALPPGLVHFVVFPLFIASGAFLLAQFFGYEDPFIGLSILMIYLYLPILVLALLNTLIGFWDPVLGIVLAYLKEIPKT